MLNIKRTFLPYLAALSVLAFAATGCNPPAQSNDSGGGEAPKTSGSDAPATGARKMPTAEGNKDSGSGDIKIGLVASLNGDLKPWGEDSQRGAQLAVEEFNAAGGLNGRKVNMMVEDSQSKPEQGKTAAEKLISDGALLLIGEVASGITEQMAQSAFEMGVPVIAVGATKTSITADRANVFRVCYIDDFQGPVMAKFAYEELGLRNVAVMTDNRQIYSQYLSQTFSDHFKKLGGTIADEQKYESGQTQFTSQLNAIKGKQPDGLFLSGYFTEVGPIIREATSLGINVPFIGGDGWDSREIFTNAGEGIKNGFFCNHYNNFEDREAVKTFLAAWKTKYGGEPATTMGALGYDAAKLALDSLKRASALDSKSLIEALENTENFAAVSGDITLKGKGGNPPKRAIVVGLDPEKRIQTFKKAYDYFTP